MSGVKIQLSPKEIEMASDPELILTKNRIMSGVMELLGDTAAAMVAFSQANKHCLPTELFTQPPKISRGEQYRQLPWMMLDYPRVFDPAETLAVRQFFWWGNFFSSTLLVSGRCKETVVNRIDSWPADAFICVHTSPWEHHFGLDNYLPLHTTSSEELDGLHRQRDFLKLSLRLPVSQWAEAPAFLESSFRKWMALLGS